MKRLFDIVLSFIGLLFFSPVMIFLSLWISLESKGPILFVQERIGRNGNPFNLFKFRSMLPESDKKGLLTIGNKDKRITKSGYFLRKYKLDELPQLWNVFIGDMSFVGPRPEVAKFVEYYNDEERTILKVRPGITDLASIRYRDETELLKDQEDPERYYIDVIMKDKIRLNKIHINDKNPFKDINVIFKTLVAVIK